jgi:hypothetical protein
MMVSSCTGDHGHVAIRRVRRLWIEWYRVVAPASRIQQHQDRLDTDSLEIFLKIFTLFSTRFSPPSRKALLCTSSHPLNRPSFLHTKRSSEPQTDISHKTGVSAVVVVAHVSTIDTDPVITTNRVVLRRWNTWHLTRVSADAADAGLSVGGCPPLPSRRHEFKTALQGLYDSLHREDIRFRTQCLGAHVGWLLRMTGCDAKNNTRRECRADG